jgi:DNA-binding MurR/RpiR family transcriptional regulator
LGATHIFSLIKSRYNTFTNTEKKVADYILKNMQDVMYMSITDLAIACNAGESSIFRFCKSLDLKGYQEFKIVLAHSLSGEQDIISLYNDVSLTDSLEDIPLKILTKNIQTLKETSQFIQKEDIAKVVHWMVQAHRIYFFGVGSSLITAMDAKNKFMRITNKTECSVDAHLQMMNAALMTENDVAIIISYSGSTKDIIELAKVAKDKHAKIVALTRYAKSPLTTYSDVIFITAADEGPLQGGSLTAKISQLYLLDILYVEYFKQTAQDSAKNKELTSKAVVNKLL